MQELSRLRITMSAEDNKERQYILELLEEKKSLLRANDELRC